MIENLPLTLVDVGALGGMQGKWQNLTRLKFVGFEPDGRGDQRPKESANKTIWPVGLAGVAGTYPFYLTRDPCNSSLLKPNLHLIKTLAWNEADYDILKTLEVDCRTLDEICRDGLDPDMIKLDTQGSELEILQGARAALERLLAVEVEVEFLPLYDGQKLFADVDAFMRSQGFILMDLGNQLYVKGRASQDFNIRKGYLVTADALYFKAPERFLSLASSPQSKQKLLSLLPICHVYGYLNFAFDIFTRLKNESPTLYSAFEIDPLQLIKNHLPPKKVLTVSERKYSFVRDFIERRIKKTNANWNYGLGNPPT